MYLRRGTSRLPELVSDPFELFKTYNSLYRNGMLRVFQLDVHNIEHLKVECTSSLRLFNTNFEQV